jgi:hypothetical protein
MDRRSFHKLTGLAALKTLNATRHLFTRARSAGAKIIG